MATDCPYGEPEQGTLGRYPCLGGCGCWTYAPTTCLACWLAARTAEDRTRAAARALTRPPR